MKIYSLRNEPAEPCLDTCQVCGWKYDLFKAAANEYAVTNITNVRCPGCLVKLGEKHLYACNCSLCHRFFPEITAAYPVPDKAETAEKQDKGRATQLKLHV